MRPDLRPQPPQQFGFGIVIMFSDHRAMQLDIDGIDTLAFQGIQNGSHTALERGMRYHAGRLRHRPRQRKQDMVAFGGFFHKSGNTEVQSGQAGKNILPRHSTRPSSFLRKRLPFCQSRNKSIGFM